MSYCRFQNTAGDLDECLDALVDGEELSQDELRAARRMVQTCRELIQAAADHNQLDADDDGESDGE